MTHWGGQGSRRAVASMRVPALLLTGSFALTKFTSEKPTSKIPLRIEPMKFSTTVNAMIATIWISAATVTGAETREEIPRFPPRELRTVALRQATAALAVAQAALEIADERPILPDTRPHSQSNSNSNVRPTSPHEAPGEPKIPMRIEFPKTAVLDDPLPAQLVVGHWAKGCAAGDRQERDIRRVLNPAGWRIGNGATDQIQFVHISQEEPCPQLTLYQNGVVLSSWNSYQDPVFLSHELRRAWDSAPTPQLTMVTAGPAGVLHARFQIESALACWREHIGEGTIIKVSWDRTGAQTFPLLAKGDWSAVALFGQSGRIEVAATGAKSIPINSLGLGYRVTGEDISIDLDPVLLKGLATRLGTANKQTYETNEDPVSRIGPMTMWTITTIVRDVFSLLHPSCDLQLGGNLSATAELNGELLAIDFQQGPSIKLIALFTFQLSVKRVEITPKSVRLVFGGSRLVKERTFQVK